MTRNNKEIPDEPLKFFWVGWNSMDSIPDEWCVERWPERMRAWRTGRGSGYTIWTGRVQARDADEAWDTIIQCYSGRQEFIVPRWEPTEYDGQPLERFPE